MTNTRRIQEDYKCKTWITTIINVITLKIYKMTIRLRNKKICTRHMSLTNLTRVLNAIEWEIVKASDSSRESMLKFIRLILNKKITRLINKLETAN